MPIESYDDNTIYTQTTQGKSPIVAIYKITKKYFSGRSYMAYRAKGHKELGMMNLNTHIPYSMESKAYYNKWYYFFSKYDKGIFIDEDSWSSVTPEEIAKHIAWRCVNAFGNDVIVIDGLCGIGGNTV